MLSHYTPWSPIACETGVNFIVREVSARRKAFLRIACRLAEVRAKVPRASETHFKLGMLYFDQEKWQQAEASFKKAHETYTTCISAAHPRSRMCCTMRRLLRKTGSRGTRPKRCKPGQEYARRTCKGE